MVKHIVIGRTEKNAPPICVYAGDLASEAEAAKLNFPQCSTFETFSQLQGVVKRNPDFQPIPGPAAESPIVQDQSEDETSEPATKPTKAKK